MKTIEQVSQEIEQAAPVTDTWRETLNIGQHIRQGDVILKRVADDHPRGAVIADGESVQVAVGQNVGARHVMTGGRGVRVYAPAKPGPLVGPVVVVDEGCEGLLTHPEHRHFAIQAGTYAVIFQRDYMSEELARVQD